jgi:hypothetical protein
MALLNFSVRYLMDTARWNSLSSYIANIFDSIPILLVFGVAWSWINAVDWKK